MNRINLSLCDTDDIYITMFASYLLEKLNNKVNIHVFTTPESYFASEQKYNLEILSEDFEEVSHFKSGEASIKYILSEEESSPDKENYIYKYQSMENIIAQIELLAEASEGFTSSKRNVSGKTEIIGIYSPASHELQMPFAFAFCKAVKEEGRVLFLDLEELSVMNSMFDCGEEENVMDLIFDLESGSNVADIDSYIHKYMGIDYINPTYNPNELCEIEEESWIKLFEVIKELNYGKVIILFGRTIKGFNKIVTALDQLIVLGKPGDYFERSKKLFMEYLNRIDMAGEVKDVVLPMSATNLSDGTYCLEELMAGNLGMYVNNLVASGA